CISKLLEVCNVFAVFPFSALHIRSDFLELDGNRVDPISCKVSASCNGTESAAAIRHGAISVGTVETGIECDFEDFFIEFVFQMIIPCMVSFIIKAVFEFFHSISPTISYVGLYHKGCA